MSDKKNEYTPKNFIAKMKYFLIEPVKNSKEADARKKEIMPFFFISLGATVLFIILGSIIKPIAMIFNVIGYIGMFFVFVFGWCLYKAISLKKKFKDLECSKCGTVIKYSPDFTITEKNKSFSISDKKTENSKAGLDLEVSGHEATNVEIIAKCQECGTEKTVTKLFTTLSCTMVRRGVSALSADMVIMEMRKVMQQAYDNGMENVPSEIKVSTKTTGEKEMIAYFKEDGTASNTPYGRVTATKKK